MLHLPTRDISLALYRWQGPQDQPTIVLLHGTGFCAETWNPVAKILSQKYTVLAIDRRGHGRSSKPKGDYSFLTFSKDLIALFEHLQLSNTLVLAHSAGATVALFALAKRPDLFHSLVAVEPITIPFMPNFALPSPMAIMAAKRRADFESKNAWKEQYSKRNPFHLWHPDALQGFINSGLINTENGAALACPPLLEAQMYDDALKDDPSILKKISKTIHVVGGENTAPLHKKMISFFQSLQPKAKLHSIQNATHTVPMDQPEALAALAIKLFYKTIF